MADVLTGLVSPSMHRLEQWVRCTVARHGLATGLMLGALCGFVAGGVAAGSAIVTLVVAILLSATVSILAAIGLALLECDDD